MKYDRSKGVDNLTFSSLCWLRKLTLIFVWIITTLFFWGAIIWLFAPEIMGNELSFSNEKLVAMTAFLVIYSTWIHIAIVKRRLKHLILIALLQLFPLFNVLGALMFAGVYYASKKEVQH